VVALDIPWDAGFVRALEEIWAAGDAVAPLDPRHPAPAARDLVATIRPTHVIGPDGECVRMEGGLPAEPGDSLVVATSGSRGAPKAVVLTGEAVRESAERTSRRLEVEPSRDKWLACIPLSHAGGLGVVTRSVITGTPLTVHERFDATLVEHEAVAHGVTLVSLVQAALARVDASLFRAVLLGGAAPPPGLPPNVVTTYGMTETCGGVVYDGVPLDGVEVAVDEGGLTVDEGGVAVDEGDGAVIAGEVLLRGPMLLRAYRDGSDPKLAGGWLPTGDAGTVDSDGRLHVSGRISDTINTGGEKVWPAAVERVMSAHPKVAEVAVCGRADPEWGERVVAFVVWVDRSDPVGLDELRSWVAEQLPRWASPRELVPMAALPRTASGKIARLKLP
jgi:O-succinylbenzoic acid--CoA ligase